VRLLLDEMLTGSKEIFEALGWDVVTVNMVGLNGKSDREVTLYAKEHDLLLVTRDELPCEIAKVIGARCFRITDTMIAVMASERMKRMLKEE